MNGKFTGATSTRAIIILVIILFLGAGVYYFMNNRAIAPAGNGIKTTPQAEEDKSPATQDIATTTPNRIQLDTTVDTGKSVPVYSSGEEETQNPDIQVVAINYDGKEFSPVSVNIKVGDYVIFYNKGTSAFWPASGPHPTHTSYPEFDAKKAIDAGGKFQFEFTKTGTWSFHDHLNPSAKGTVIVTQ